VCSGADDRPVRQELPDGTVTFLFTDIEGSTMLLHELGADAYAASLAEHRRIVRDACVAEGGVEVDTQGDAFFFAFASAPGAVSAAQAMTEELAGGPIHLRIGLHTGTPLVTDEGYVGDDVHFAARVAASGHGGQVVLSRVTRDLVEALPLTDLGEHRLKDIEGPVSIFQLGEESFPPLKTISNTNLPHATSTFVGRERELGEVLDAIQSARLLTLTGPGGSGKTRLALEAATTLVPSFKAGVFWVGLSSLRDPALVAETIAQTLGAKEGLAEHIAERELLLLLDNFEQVVDAAPELAQLLERCPNLQLLVTSREVLRVAGEVDYPVPPLAESDAVELFCERSRLEPDAAVAELCRSLDDLPLALELAAARTSVLSPAQILDRLGQRLDLLKGGRGAETRQQTLRATIEWSHELLDEHEQRLFARLAVFRGGCTLDMAEEVAQADLDVLQSLVDKNLVRHTGERFWMLETIRSLARERLAASVEGVDLRRRHAAAMLRLFDAGYKALGDGQEHAPVYARLLVEHDNLRVALEWSYDSGEDALIPLARHLTWFFAPRGHGPEAQIWLERALERRATAPPPARMRLLASASTRLAGIGDYRRSDALIAEWLQLAREAGDEQEVLGAMNSAALNAAEQGDLDRARSQLAEIKTRAEEIGNSEMVAFAIVNLGDVAWRARDFRSSLESSAAAVELFRQRSDDGGVATSLGLCGWASLALADARAAEGFFREALAIVTRIGWIRGAAENSCGLGVALIELGDTANGAQLFGAAAVLYAEHGIASNDELQDELRARATAEAEAALGQDAFTAAWERGQAMTHEEIVAFAES
jgi:predicted ATPase/class 3 adenylate cyclase